MPPRRNSTIAADEIANFSRHAGAWWNPHGPLRSLHQLNPVRIGYVRDQIAAHGFGGKGRFPLRGLSLLDVGCGGGLLCEPLARLGAKVTGLDASSAAIAEAKRHAEAGGLDIDYRAGSVEDLAEGAKRYDVITALEIVEHVADLDRFIVALSQLLKPNGLLILSTVNRTPKSFMLGIVAAEYILRWVPRGTHHWKQFVKPSELVQRLEANSCEVTDISGITYRPLSDDFVINSDDCDVNYMMVAVRR